MLKQLGPVVMGPGSARLYLDGMQLPYGASMFGQPKVDLNLLERVEVLKGPSSALYGQIAPGGLVNLVSRLPSTTPTNSVEFLANSWGRAQTNFDVGGADTKGDFMYRIAARCTTAERRSISSTIFVARSHHLLPGSQISTPASRS